MSIDAREWLVRHCATCHRRTPYGTVTPQFSTVRVRSTPWHSHVTSAQRSISQAITSVTPTTRRSAPSIRTSSVSARWLRDRSGVSASALVASAAARSRRRSSPLFRYGTDHRIRPERSVSLTATGPSGDKAKVRPPSRLVRTRPTSPFASKPNPARAFPV
jgi:hypothetical protein